MYLCSDGHEEVCHEDLYCPLCRQIELAESLDEEVNGLVQEIERLGYEILDLKEELDKEE